MGRMPLWRLKRFFVSPPASPPWVEGWHYFRGPPLPTTRPLGADALTDARREDDPGAPRATPRSVPAVGYARSPGLRDHEGRAPRLDPGAGVDSSRAKWLGP